MSSMLPMQCGPLAWFVANLHRSDKTPLSETNNSLGMTFGEDSIETKGQSAQLYADKKVIDLGC